MEKRGKMRGGRGVWNKYVQAISKKTNKAGTRKSLFPAHYGLLKCRLDQ